MHGAEGKVLLVRRYVPDDALHVWALHEKSMAGMPAHENENFWDDLLDIPRHFFALGGEFLVGQLGVELIAMGGFSPLSPRVIEIKRMRVHPDQQRKGFGKTVLFALEAAALERGHLQVCLETAVIQTSALALYRATGYKETDRITKMGFEVVRMRKELVR